MDSTTSLEQIIQKCLKVGINCLAIADHNTIGGALKLREIAPFTIIVAEEIMTSGGEIIGLFLEQEIPDKLPITEAIARIKEQKGLVCIPHPYDTLRFSAFNNRAFEEIMPHVDIIEVFNSRSLSPRGEHKSKLLARRYNKIASCGSDAHIASEIGKAYVEMPEFSGRDDFLAALAKGKIFGSKSSPAIHFASSWARLKKQLF